MEEFELPENNRFQEIYVAMEEFELLRPKNPAPRGNIRD